MDEERDLLYRLWLNQSCDHDPDKVYRLLKKFGSPEAAFQANFYDPAFYRTLDLAQTLRLDRKLDSAGRLLAHCRKKGIQVISIADPAYPDRLKQIENPPQVLYALGTLPDLNRLASITVVGTRKCSPEGERIAGQLGRELADSGFGVVSGMALGIDGAAHTGALQAGGTTVAVLAGGVDLIYPTAHTELYRHIQNHGAILSERPPGTRGQAHFYRQRNRIMVGLSHGVVIVEGRERSGTSITARLAAEYNRDVFAVPGKPTDHLAELPNDLIQDGVKLVSGPLDILEEYIGVYPEMLEYGISIKGKPVVGSPRSTKTRRDACAEAERTGEMRPIPAAKDEETRFQAFLGREDFQEEERNILRFLRFAGGTAPFDDIADSCGIEAGALSSMLVILQMKKAVAQRAGGQYTLRTD